MIPHSMMLPAQCFLVSVPKKNMCDLQITSCKWTNSTNTFFLYCSFQSEQGFLHMLPWKILKVSLKMEDLYWKLMWQNMDTFKVKKYFCKVLHMWSGWAICKRILTISNYWWIIRTRGDKQRFQTIIIDLFRQFRIWVRWGPRRNLDRAFCLFCCSYWQR